jgi:DNA polymerase III alpha subunit (gram-positive type)
MSDVQIYFDLETTGLNTRSSEIVQIGAVHENGSEFMRYIIPNGQIGKGASRVNGITKHNGRLYKNGELIEDAADPSHGLNEFLRWIEDNSQYGDRVILIGHNAIKFDAPMLMTNAINNNVRDIDGLCRIIWGFSDTLLHFKREFKFPRYNQKLLMSKFGMNNNQIHDALQDVKDLMELTTRASRQLKITPREFVKRYKYTRNISLYSSQKKCQPNNLFVAFGYSTEMSSSLLVNPIGYKAI